MNSLTEKTGEEYEVAFSKLPLGIFGRSEFEILQDKQRHTVVYPRSLNDRAHFRMSLYLRESLANLEVGFAPDGTGTQIVGTLENFVNRKFVDAFVGCVSEVYNNSWVTINVWIRGNIRLGPLPVFLAGETLAMTIAPHLFRGQHLESTGKYQPTLALG